MKISVIALSAALTVTTVGKTMADAGDIAGGIVGGIIGGVIVNEANKNRQRQQAQPRKVYRAAPSYSAERAEAREVQTALNYFGFPAGTPDGILGRQSRSAISQYQAHLNYPVTGYLTEYEKGLLLTSYQRALAGGPVTLQQIAANPMGPRGLLLTYRDQAAGVYAAAPVPATPAPAQVVPVAPAPVPVVPAPLPPTTLATLPAETPQSAKPTLPNFGGAETERLSLASHCNGVSLVTNTNGGFITLAAMADRGAVLNEQFCLARTYAIAQGEALAASIQGVSPSQVEAQCQAFAPVMAGHMSALAASPRDVVVKGVKDFAFSTGMAPDQLETTSKVCLSVGYRTDDLDVAMGSALLLVALGVQPYAELLGHHLEMGFGIAERPDLAGDWYAMALDAVEAGQPAVFAPGQPERTALIRAAALDGAPGPETVLPAASELPSFKIAE
jgi:hypothetical protein